MQHEIAPENLTIYECYKLLKKSIDEVSPNIAKKLDEFKEELTTKLKEANEKIQKLENTNKELLKQIEYNERAIKKNNLIIFGLEEEEDENILNKVLTFFAEKLSINDITKSDINAVHRFGRENHLKTKPVVVKLLSLHRKTEIFRNCHRLKNSGYSIANDLTALEQENQKILRKHLKESREKNLNSYISRNRLYINNTSYTSEELKEIEISDQTEETEEDPENINAEIVPHTSQLKDETKKRNATAATPITNTASHRTEEVSRGKTNSCRIRAYPNRRQATRK